jgi:hypothetical protein
MTPKEAAKLIKSIPNAVKLATDTNQIAMEEILRTLLEAQRLVRENMRSIDDITREISKSKDDLQYAVVNSRADESNNRTNNEKEDKLNQLEHKLDENKSLDNSELNLVDTIRTSVLQKKEPYATVRKSRRKEEYSSEEHQYLLEKSRGLLLKYFDKQFDDLYRKVIAKGTETIEDEKEKMRLSHLKFRIEQNDPRNLKEIKKEFVEFRRNAEELSEKILHRPVK